jgi:hypothetical protein
MVLDMLERSRATKFMLFEEGGDNPWYFIQSIVPRLVVIDNGKYARGSSRIAGCICKPLFIFHFYSLVIEDP